MADGNLWEALDAEAVDANVMDDRFRNGCANVT